MDRDIAPSSTSNGATSSTSRAWAFVAIAYAWLLLVVGCGAALVTVAHGGYTGVLRFAIFCAAIAAILLAFGILRGGKVARVFAVLGIAPFLFIVFEFISRG
jgi:hypothetical protein